MTVTPAELLPAELREVRAQVEQLGRDLAGIVAASEGSNADDEHDPEGATIGFERAQLSALLYAARRRVVEVEQALEQVRDGGYGTCALCGGAIGAERLTACPSARTCISCASARRR